MERVEQHRVFGGGEGGSPRWDVDEGGVGCGYFLSVNDGGSEDENWGDTEGHGRLRGREPSLGSLRDGALRNWASLFLSQRFKLVERAGPVGAEQAGEAAVGEDFAASLADGAVVGLVVGVADALDRRAALGAREIEAAVDGHLGTEGGDLLGEFGGCFGVEAVDPGLQGCACGNVEAVELGEG